MKSNIKILACSFIAFITVIWVMLMLSHPLISLSIVGVSMVLLSMSPRQKPTEEELFWLNRNKK